MENIYLIGSEDVRNAARIIIEASENMTRAADTIDNAVRTFGQHVDRLIESMERIREEESDLETGP